MKCIPCGAEGDEAPCASCGEDSWEAYESDAQIPAVVTDEDGLVVDENPLEDPDYTLPDHTLLDGLEDEEVKSDE